MEILIAILVVAFGCALIAVLYTSAMNLNINASKNDEAFYNAVSDMEQMFDSGTSSGSGKVVIEDEAHNSIDVSVNIYGEGDNSAYKRK